MFRFTVTHTDGDARCGLLELPHGAVETPAFMPVGTQGTVKAIAQDELEELGYHLILGNTYHLFLRPGTDTVEKAGDLHRFMAWPRNILTDSGGYQVMSLASMRRLSDEGVEFRSHLDGSLHVITPERAMQIQRALGSDICMALDECPPFPCTKDEAAAAARRTHEWAFRCVEARTPGQNAYGIVQGGVHEDLRRESVQTITAMPFDGFAIGGVSVGESVESQYAVTRFTAPLLPRDKPRYLMGVGTPQDIVQAVSCGVDQFDCVLPTRVGRHMAIYTAKGRVNLGAARHTEDFGPPDPDCDCRVCARYSRAYLRHLFRAGELLAARLATYHNLAFYAKLMIRIREAIRAGRFAAFSSETSAQLNGGA